MRAAEPELYASLADRYSPDEAYLHALAMDLTLAPRVEKYILAQRTAVRALSEAVARYTDACTDAHQTQEDATVGVPDLLLRTAAALAGHRRRYLHEAWMADLAEDPVSGAKLPPWRRRAVAGGFLIAALQLRLHDSLGLMWRPVDWILASTSRIATTITAATGSLAVYINFTDGMHELLTTGVPTCTATALSLSAVAWWLRRVRAVELTDRERHRENPDSGQ